MGVVHDVDFRGVQSPVKEKVGVGLMGEESSAALVGAPLGPNNGDFVAVMEAQNSVVKSTVPDIAVGIANVPIMEEDDDVWSRNALEALGLPGCVVRIIGCR